MASKFKPLNTREWLENMLRFNSRDADRARELLVLLDETDEREELLTEYSEEIGEIPEAKKIFVEHEALVATLEHDALAREFTGAGPDDHDGQLQAALEYAAKCEAFMFEVRWLCQEADLIGPEDETTDVLPLLRMFLPI